MNNNQSIEDYRGTVQRIMVCHTAVTKAIKSINRTYSGSYNNSDNRSTLIIGESGTGKTRILKQFENMYPCYRETDGLKVPVLQAIVPSAPTPNSLVQELLFKIGDPSFDKGIKETKIKRLITYIKHTDTKVIVLDEFQHLVDQGSFIVAY